MRRRRDHLLATLGWHASGPALGLHSDESAPNAKPSRVAILEPTPEAMSFNASDQADRAAANRENCRGFQRVMACQKVLEHDVQTTLEALSSSYTANITQVMQGFRDEANIWVQGWISAHNNLGKTFDLDSNEAAAEELAAKKRLLADVERQMRSMGFSTVMLRSFQRTPQQSADAADENDIGD